MSLLDKLPWGKRKHGRTFNVVRYTPESRNPLWSGSVPPSSATSSWNAPATASVAVTGYRAGTIPASIRPTIKGIIDTAIPMDFVDTETIYYLSGPMAGYPEHNFPAFESAARMLRDNGMAIQTPHEIQHAPGTVDREDFLRRDLIEMLEMCSGIIMMDGWMESWGANFELHVAAKLGYQIRLLRGDVLCHGEELRAYVI